MQKWTLVLCKGVQHSPFSAFDWETQGNLLTIYHYFIHKDEKF